MESVEQSDRETWRLIMLDEGRKKTLVVPDESGSSFTLPCVEIPRWQRHAENLTQAIKNKWNCDAICLFTPTTYEPCGSSNTLHYEVLECLRHSEADSNCAWIPIQHLGTESFRDKADFPALQQSLVELDCHAGDSSTPFARAGWFSELQNWIEDVIGPRGLQLSGAFLQLNGTSCFSLVRFETNGPDVWFKAAGKPNLREFPITLELARLFPAFVPEIVGQRPDWNGWLSVSAGATSLSERKDLDAWEIAATSLARLQVESMENFGSILNAGAHDLGLNKLCSLVQPFLDVVARLMREQTKVPPAILTDDDLSLLALRLQDAFTMLEDLRIPDAVGHLDLNSGNIIVSTDGCKFVDWAEACVGLPFLSFQYLLEHFRQGVGSEAGLESRLVTAYCHAWDQLLPRDVIAEALAFAPLLAVFAYAAGSGVWRDEQRLRDPKSAGYIRSLARRMNREAVQLIDRRSPCLS